MEAAKKMISVKIDPDWHDFYVPYPLDVIHCNVCTPVLTMYILYLYLINIECLVLQSCNSYFKFIVSLNLLLLQNKRFPLWDQ